MLKSFANRLFCCGISSEQNGNISPIKIINALAALVAVCLLTRIPVFISLWQFTNLTASLCAVLAFFMMPVVLLLNHMGKFSVARNLFVFSYGWYIACAALLWTADLHIQFFLLLGIFVCPFVFYPHEKSQASRWMLIFFVTFIAIDSYWCWQNHLSNARNTELLMQTANSAVVALVILLCSIQISRNTNEHRDLLEKQSEFNKRLLQNTLPKSIVHKMRSHNQQIAAYHSRVSILFADIQGFSILCEQKSAQQVVDLLNQLFCQFDAVVEQFNLEKIKTIGDEYMVVAGAPETCEQHAQQICRCALALQKVFCAFALQHKLTNQLRIGIATGDAMAGVIGKRKLSYDLWGFTVNLAARMQEYAIAGEIQVCRHTFNAAQTSFKLQYSGRKRMKGVGEHPTYRLISS